MDDKTLAAEQLVKIYRANQVTAVDGVSFTVREGEIVGLLGPNGAGKTTTVKMLLGLVEPTSGSAFLAGYDIRKHRHRALAHAGAILEGARNIYWRLTARRNLDYFGTLRGLSGRALRERIETVLHMVGMADRADEETRYLSRGMQQKVALALALIHDPKVLLLDEPTLGLDVQSARAIESTVRELAGQGKAILLTTHQMALAQKVCDRIVVIDKGRVIEAGTTREVVNRFGDGQETVQVRLEGLLPEGLGDKIVHERPGMMIDSEADETLITWTGAEVSQEDVLNFLGQLNSLGLSIRSVGKREATLEEVFVRLTGGETEKG